MLALHTERLAPPDCYCDEVNIRCGSRADALHRVMYVSLHSFTNRNHRTTKVGPNESEDIAPPLQRAGGTGPADPASAKPIISSYLINIHFH